VDSEETERQQPRHNTSKNLLGIDLSNVDKSLKELFEEMSLQHIHSSLNP